MKEGRQAGGMVGKRGRGRDGENEEGRRTGRREGKERIIKERHDSPKILKIM